MSVFLDLPPSAIIVLDKLEHQGPMTPKDISREVSLAPRTVSFALGKLIRQNLCKKIPNLRDMRQPLYLVNEEKAKEIRVRFESVFKQFLK
jgi:DNA-binding MarR family transcriptional regulator